MFQKPRFHIVSHLTDTRPHKQIDVAFSEKATTTNANGHKHIHIFHVPRQISDISDYVKNFHEMFIHFTIQFIIITKRNYYLCSWFLIIFSVLHKCISSYKYTTLCSTNIKDWRDCKCVLCKHSNCCIVIHKYAYYAPIWGTSCLQIMYHTSIIKLFDNLILLHIRRIDRTEL